MGYNADMKPFVFFNSKHELVGYDVGYMYELARGLGLQLQFVPYTWQKLVNDLEANKFDIAIGAIYVTEPRLQQVSFTEPYYKSPAAMIVAQKNKDQFNSVPSIRSLSDLRMGVFNDPVLIPIINNNFPQAKVVILPDFQSETLAQAFKSHSINAVFWSRAQTDIWALGHPDYVSVAPSELAAPFLMGYMVQNNSPLFLNFLNYWLELKKNDGFEQHLYNQWILARPEPDDTPRWSILRNVLHWQR